MWKEFQEFAVHGDVVELAVAAIIGGALGKIVASFVHDILMPPIGRFLGGVDFANFFLVLAGSQIFATPADAEKVGVADAQLRRVPAEQSRLHHHRVLDLPGCEAGEPPATKDYGFCLMAVPARATRWPHCTSQLG